MATAALPDKSPTATKLPPASQSPNQHARGHSLKDLRDGDGAARSVCGGSDRGMDALDVAARIFHGDDVRVTGPVPRRPRSVSD